MQSSIGKEMSSRLGGSRWEYSVDEAAEEETLGMLNFKLNVLPRILARKEIAKEDALKKVQLSIPASGQALGETLDLLVNFLSFAPITVNFNPDRLLQLSQSEKIMNVWEEGRPTARGYLENRTRIEALLAGLTNASTPFKEEFLLKEPNPEKRPTKPMARPVYGALQITGPMEVSQSGAAKEYGAGAFFLRSDVKKYTSFTPTDSVELGSNERIADKLFSERMAAAGNMYPLVGYAMPSVVRELNEFAG